MLRTSILVLAAALAASPALAQAPAPASAGLGGPQIPGVCLISQQEVLGRSKVGQVVDARLRDLIQQANAEVAAQRDPLEAEAKALSAKRSSMTAAAFAAAQRSLEARAQSIQALANQRSHELEATRNQAFSQIATQAQPVVAQVYTAHSCGLLLDRSVVLGGNLGNDLTPGVIQGLDAKITTLDVQRVSLPPQQGGAPGQ